MEMPLAVAAEMTGKSKSTLLRAVNSGKLSARRTDEGSFVVDASELARVFTMKRVKEAMTAHHDASRSEDDADDAAREAELAELRLKAARLEERLTIREEQLTEQRETVSDLRKRLDRAEDHVRALTYQANQVQAAKTTKGFLDWLREWIRPQAG